MRASSGGPSNRGAPLGFWRIHTSPGAIEGALHARHEPVTGSGMETAHGRGVALLDWVPVLDLR